MNKDLKLYYWFTIGTKAHSLMEQNRYASAARLIAWGVANGIYEPDNQEGSDWRTSILMNYAWL